MSGFVALIVIGVFCLATMPRGNPADPFSPVPLIHIVCAFILFAGALAELLSAFYTGFIASGFFYSGYRGTAQGLFCATTAPGCFMQECKAWAVQIPQLACNASQLPAHIPCQCSVVFSGVPACSIQP